MEQFFKAVEGFWTNSEEHVCVFDTDGGNSAGFLIVSFLVRVITYTRKPSVIVLCDAY